MFTTKQPSTAERETWPKHNNYTNDYTLEQVPQGADLVNENGNTPFIVVAEQQTKDRKFHRVVGAKRESKRPQNLAAIPDTREVRFWP